MADTLIRKQIYLPKRQNLLLKRLSRERGVSEAEIIRQALDRETEIRSTVIRRNIAAWTKILQFVRERKETTRDGAPWQWNRQELYDERESRWFKSNAE
jgi:hypothetical protein